MHAAPDLFANVAPFGPGSGGTLPGRDPGPARAVSGAPSGAAGAGAKGPEAPPDNDFTAVLLTEGAAAAVARPGVAPASTGTMATEPRGVGPASALSQAMSRLALPGHGATTPNGLAGNGLPASGTRQPPDSTVGTARADAAAPTAQASGPLGHAPAAATDAAAALSLSSGSNPVSAYAAATTAAGALTVAAGGDQGTLSLIGLGANLSGAIGQRAEAGESGTAIPELQVEATARRDLMSPDRAALLLPTAPGFGTGRFAVSGLAASGAGGATPAGASTLDAIRSGAAKLDARSAARRLEVLDSSGQESLRLAQPEPSSPAVTAKSQPTAIGLTRAEPVPLDQAVGERLAWLIQHGKQDARIQIKPESLGHLDIKVSIDGDDAHLSFTSPHGTVRDALELAVPRLRDMLSGAGLNLGQFEVGAETAESAGSRERESAASRSESSTSLPAADDPPTTQVRGATPVSLHLVDTFV